MSAKTTMTRTMTAAAVACECNNAKTTFMFVEWKGIVCRNGVRELARISSWKPHLLHYNILAVVCGCFFYSFCCHSSYSIHWMSHGGVCRSISFRWIPRIVIDWHFLSFHSFRMLPFRFVLIPFSFGFFFFFSFFGFFNPTKTFSTTFSKLEFDLTNYSRSPSKHAIRQNCHNLNCVAARNRFFEFVELKFNTRCLNNRRPMKHHSCGGQPA